MTRTEQLQAVLVNQPAYRLEQVNQALFDLNNKSIQDVTTLSKEMRTKLVQDFLWMTVTAEHVYESNQGDTFKAVLLGHDQQAFESVLMRNKRGYWTICVSSQVGCAMACTFCATGTMGLKRSLTSEEIIDQYRFWQQFLHTRRDLAQRISNVVFMGMGEPLANYENVKEAVKTWLKYADLGPTKITVSSVGILSQLEKLLTDKDWPKVRIAISLHSAIESTRKKIVPSTPPDFLARFKNWALKYEKFLGNRSHYLTFEYIMLKGINDDIKHAEAVARYAKLCGVKKINVIPYNQVDSKVFFQSEADALDEFKRIIKDKGVDVTQRKNMGNDIAAACGQLVVKSAPVV